MVVPIATCQDATESEFGFVDKIYVRDGEVLLGIKLLVILNYSTHYHSYKVEYTDDCYIVALSSLASHQVLTPRPVRGSNNHFYITLKYNIM